MSDDREIDREVEADVKWRPTSTSRTVAFSKDERARLAIACQTLGIYFGEFVHDAFANHS